MGELFEGLQFNIFPNDRKEETKSLRRLIREHGGSVIDYSSHDYTNEDDAAQLKSAQGIALVDPSTLKAPSLFERKTRQNGQLKYINWGYPQYCIAQDRVVDVEEARGFLVLCQFPREDGGYCCFLSPSLKISNRGREKYEDKIEQHGGKVVQHAAHAVICIVPNDELGTSREKFKHTNTRPETIDWLNDAITDFQYVKFTPPVKSTMPGRKPYNQSRAKARVEYTAEDDNFLVRFLAECAGDRGRLGNYLYQQLVQLYPDQGERHSWQSWRTRYKNDKEEFDRQIERYKEKHAPVHPDGWTQDWRTEATSNMTRVKHSSGSKRKRSIADEDSYSQDDSQHESGSIRHGSRPRNTRKVIETEAEESEVEEQEEPVLREEEHDDGPQVIDDAHETVNTDNFDDNVDKVPSSTPPPPRIERSQGVSTQATAIDFSSLTTQPDFFKASDEEKEVEEELQASFPNIREIQHIDQIEQRKKARSLNRTSDKPHEFEEEGIEARSFKASGSVRKERSSRVANNFHPSGERRHGQ